MRETFLESIVPHPGSPSNPEKLKGINRRQFLHTAGVVGVGLALSTKAVLARGLVLEQDTEFRRWRDRVTGFVYTVCSDGRAREINSQIYRANWDYTPRANDFHTYYSAPIIFVGMMINPERVICGNGFELNRFPYYDAQCPCRGSNDLNAFEIITVTHEKEINRFGCVLTPQGQRSRMQYGDHADYRNTVSKYGQNPDDMNVLYKRPFAGKGRVRYGYHVSHKTKIGENNQPFRDVFISSEDI